MSVVVHKTSDPRSDNAPTRTCVGCRRPERQETLVRVALGPGGVLAVDHPRRLGGRGAYVHADGRCVRQAMRRGALSRALKSAVATSEAELLEAMRQRFVQRVTSLLAAARKSGKAEAGACAVVAAVRDGRAELVVLAADSSAGREEVQAAVRARAGQAVPRVVELGKKEDLGAIWGREVLGVVAVTDRGLAGAIAAEIGSVEGVCEGSA